ncbi:ExbD/TolR family protein, partial [Pseudomonas viridiflava]|uniref:ExbD/TolR family protein n=1 Tax=Pseudomonas viridiflava TaxID=33069 RepID=UPI0019825A04
DIAASLEDMQGRVAQVVAERPDTQVFIRADDKADYGRVVAAMAALQHSGVTQLGLVAEAPQ